MISLIYDKWNITNEMKMYSGKHSTFMSLWKESQQKFLFCELWDFPVNLDKSVSESEPSDLSSTRFWGMTETFYFESQLDYKMMQPLKFKQLTHCAIRTLKYILIHRQIHRQMKCGVYKQWNIIQLL